MPSPSTSAEISLPPALSLSSAEFMMTSEMGQSLSWQRGRMRMCPPSPSMPIAWPTPVEERSSVWSAVFEPTSAPIMPHVTRLSVPFSHVFDMSTFGDAPSAMEPVSSGTGSVTVDVPPPREAEMISSVSSLSLPLSAFASVGISSIFRLESFMCVTVRLPLRQPASRRNGSGSLSSVRERSNSTDSTFGKSPKSLQKATRAPGLLSSAYPISERALESTEAPGARLSAVRTVLARSAPAIRTWS